MERVSVTEHFDAPPETIRRYLRDQEAFMRAAGFDEVSLEGTEMHVENRVGMLSIELELEVLEEDDATFSYEQVDGIFNTMRTVYEVEADDAGSIVTATTEYELDVDFVGPLIDSTILERQRRKELQRQFEYLRERVADDED